MRRGKYLSMLAMGLALTFGARGGDAFQFPVGDYKIGYFDLAGEAGGEKPDLFAATLATVPAGHSWHAVPAKVDPASWLSLVKVKANRQCDFFVFHFADRDGTVDFASRRPSRVPIDPPRYPLTVPPGPNQIPANAIREPAGDFLYRFKAEQANERPRLRIVVVPASEMAGKRELAVGADESFEVPSTMAEAMAFAAAYAAGWQPTAAEMPNDKTLRLSLTEELRAYFSVKARLSDGASGFTREAIPKEELYDHLVRLLYRLRQPQAVAEAMPLGGSGAVLLAWSEGRAILREGGNIRAVAPASGRSPWRLEVGPREHPRYQTQRGRDGHVQIFRYDHGVKRIDLAEGKLQDLTPLGVGKEGRLAESLDGRLAVVETNLVGVYRDGKVIWSWVGASLSALPTWGDGSLYIAGADGAVHALEADQGREVWRLPSNNALDVRMTGVETQLLIDDGQTLTAVDAATGKRLWSSPTGDVLVNDPVVMDGRILIAIASNKLRLLDAQTGAVAAARDWPTWLLAVRAVRTAKGWSLACVDLQHRLSILDASTLKTAVAITLPSALAPVLEYGVDVPEVWALDRPRDTAGMDADLIGSLYAATTRNHPAWLVADQDGGVYAVSAEAVAK